MKTSETVVIKRSLIKFSPYNPRKQDKKIIDTLKRNFKKVGFLGGIVWNEKTGNLISGHKRVETLDVINKYDGSNDYDIKIEKVSLDLKTEMEQNIFMNSADAQGEYDNELLIKMLPDIDYEDAGLGEDTLSLLKAEFPETEIIGLKEESKQSIKLSDRGLSDEDLEAYRKNKREERKEILESNKEKHFEKPYIIITFRNIDDKAFICENFNGLPSQIHFKAEDIFKELI